jgi:hypothetical protein
MRGRVDKLRRIVEVQRQLVRAHESRLRDLQRRLAETEVAEREVLAALGDEHALHGLFLDTMARRLRSLGRETARIRAEAVAQSRKLLDCTAKLKTAERLTGAAEQAARCEADKRQLCDVIDVVSACATQASGKFTAS